MYDYGSKEFYADMFADLIGDCSTGTKKDEQTISNVLGGFEQAIIDWMEYHEEAASKFKELHRRYISGELS